MDWPLDELVAMDDMDELVTGEVARHRALESLHRIGLDAGEDPPGIDAQLVVPLFEQLAGAELASVVEFLGTASTPESPT